jgi:hypothetical protein
MLSEVLFQARALPRQDQLQLIQELTAGLMHEEPQTLQPFEDYSVWSPHDAHDAAAVLMSKLIQSGELHGSTTSEIPVPVTG